MKNDLVWVALGSKMSPVGKPILFMAADWLIIGVLLVIMSFILAFVSLVINGMITPFAVAALGSAFFPLDWLAIFQNRFRRHNDGPCRRSRPPRTVCPRDWEARINCFARKVFTSEAWRITAWQR